mgnify:CR=1 FL=1
MPGGFGFHDFDRPYPPVLLTFPPLRCMIQSINLINNCVHILFLMGLPLAWTLGAPYEVLTLDLTYLQIISTFDGGRKLMDIKRFGGSWALFGVAKIASPYFCT